MSALDLRRYRPADAAEWDSFVRSSKNGTFLFQRGFMDYHADRFEDHSLMIYETGKLLALLPASRSGEELASHGGLTYGGVISGAKMSAARMLVVFDAVKAHLVAEGVRTVHYKAIPQIYHDQPAEEDLYALFRNGAELVRVDASATIALPRKLAFGSGKKDGVRKARKVGLVVRESQDWEACWDLLTRVLADRHDARPVHSLDEIRLLAGRFPDNIRLFGAFDDEAMRSALVIFDCGPTVHVQYIASSDYGRTHGGVDLIVKTLIDEIYADRRWFDFGISTTNQGMALNEGLARQKEMFGARTTVYQQYRWML
jgi:hypothetical protein